MTDYHSLPISSLLARLERAGRAPDLDLVRAVYERREEAEPLVLRLFQTSYYDDFADADDPRWYRFVHAGRLLIAWRTAAALPTFADLYLDDALQDVIEAFDDAPAVFGPPAIPPFLHVLSADTGPDWHYGRATAAAILAAIARRHPETRADVVAAMRRQLPSPDDIIRLGPERVEPIWGTIAYELAALQDEASRPVVLALFAVAGFKMVDGFDLVLMDREEYEAQMRGELPDDSPPDFDLIEEYENLARIDALERQRAEATRRAREPKAPSVRPKPASRPQTAPVRIGRNDPCPCGSGKKYKHCHGKPGG